MNNVLDFRRDDSAGSPAIDRIAVEPTVSAENDVSLRKRLRELGIYTPATLNDSVKREDKKPFLIDGLIRPGSVNLLVGLGGHPKPAINGQLKTGHSR